MTLLLLFNQAINASGGSGISGAAVFDPFGGLTPIGIVSPFDMEVITFRPRGSAFQESVDALAVSTLADFALLAADLNVADALHISVEGADVRWSCTDVPPTTSTGHLTAQDTDLILRGRDIIENFQVIATSGTATLTLTALRTS